MAFVGKITFASTLLLETEDVFKKFYFEHTFFGSERRRVARKYRDGLKNWNFGGRRGYKWR